MHGHGHVPRIAGTRFPEGVGATKRWWGAFGLLVAERKRGRTAAGQWPEKAGERSGRAGATGAGDFERARESAEFEDGLWFTGAEFVARLGGGRSRCRLSRYADGIGFRGSGECVQRFGGRGSGG